MKVGGPAFTTVCGFGCVALFSALPFNQRISLFITLCKFIVSGATIKKQDVRPAL